MPKNGAVTTITPQHSGDDGDQRRFATARRADQHHQLSSAHFKIHTPQRLKRRCACAEGLGKTLAANCNLLRWLDLDGLGHGRKDQLRNTTAGSSFITLRMLSAAADRQINKTAAAVITSSCHGR